ncbi:MAG: hypothetical protein ROZ64_08100 [Burkholderiaceae bacterium]|jgi:hypothetical protein|nr:hypothetical protein [Burkholderiaceae bacterium]
MYEAVPIVDDAPLTLGPCMRRDSVRLADEIGRALGQAKYQFRPSTMKVSQRLGNGQLPHVIRFRLGRVLRFQFACSRKHSLEAVFDLLVANQVTTDAPHRPMDELRVLGQ